MSSLNENTNYISKTINTLATGNWALATKHWQLAPKHWPLATGHWPLATGYWLLILILTLSACSKKDTPSSSDTQSFNDIIYTGMTFAVEAGDIYGVIAREIFNATDIVEYHTVEDMFNAILADEVDAILISEGFTAQLQHSGLYTDLDYILIPKETYVNKAASIFHTTELRDKYNEFFAEAIITGEWQEVVDRWLNVPLPDPEDIPQFEFTGKNGVLRIVDTGNYAPLSYYTPDGRLVGFDPDMANRFAIYLGMIPEYIIVSYEEAAHYVMAGKADMSACTYAVYDDRENEMIFGIPSVITQCVLVIKK